MRSRNGWYRVDRHGDGRCSLTACRAGPGYRISRGGYRACIYGRAACRRKSCSRRPCVCRCSRGRQDYRSAAAYRSRRHVPDRQRVNGNGGSCAARARSRRPCDRVGCRSCWRSRYAGSARSRKSCGRCPGIACCAACIQRDRAAGANGAGVHRNHRIGDDSNNSAAGRGASRGACAGDCVGCISSRICRYGRARCRRKSCGRRPNISRSSGSRKVRRTTAADRGGRYADRRQRIYGHRDVGCSLTSCRACSGDRIR
jgi:hypothetical protein